MHENAGWPQFLSSEIINEIVRQTHFPTAVKLAFHVLVDPVSKTAVEWGLPSLIWLAFSKSTTEGLLQVQSTFFGIIFGPYIYIYMSPYVAIELIKPWLSNFESQGQSKTTPFAAAMTSRIRGSRMLLSVALGIVLWASPRQRGRYDFRCPENGCFRIPKMRTTPIFWFENLICNSMIFIWFHMCFFLDLFCFVKPSLVLPAFATGASFSVWLPLVHEHPILLQFSVALTSAKQLRVLDKKSMIDVFSLYQYHPVPFGKSIFFVPELNVWDVCWLLLKQFAIIWFWCFRGW